MKALFQTLARIAIILVAAFTVIGATIAINQSSATDETQPAIVQADGENFPAERPAHEEMEGGSFLFGVASLLPNLGIVGVIVLLVTQLQRLPWSRWVGHKESAAGI